MALVLIYARVTNESSIEHVAQRNVVFYGKRIEMKGYDLFYFYDVTNWISLQLGPGEELFDAVKGAVGKMDIIAEDLVSSFSE